MIKQSKLTRICNIISAVLLAALMVMQFLPFWYSVDGVHMTAEQYATYIPPEPTEDNRMTAATTAPEETTAATEASGATTETTAPAETTAPTETTAPAETTAPTEATTEATGATGATDATEAATGATEAATGATEGATEAVTEPTEDPGPVIKTVSIARAAWFPEKEKEAPVFIWHALILLLGVVGIFFCTTKGYSNINFVWSGAAAFVALNGYLTNAPAQTGMNWIYHLIPAVLLLIPTVILLVKWVIRILRALTVKE